MNYVVGNIELVREDKGVKKSHIATKCKKTPAWYTDIINGKNRLSVDDLLLVADALGENVVLFFDQELSVTLNSKQEEAMNTG